DAAIESAITRYYEKPEETESYQEILGNFELDDIEFDLSESDEFDTVDNAMAAEQAPVVKLCNLMLLNAIGKGASDIHIEPYEKSYRVRYRVGGVLRHEMQPPLKLKNAITSRFKIMA